MADEIFHALHFPTMKPLDLPKQDSKEQPAKQDETAEAAPAAPIVEEKIDFSNVQIEPLFADKKSKKLLKFVLDDGTGENRVILSGIHEYYEPEELVGKTCIAITNLPPRPMMGIESCGMLLSAIHKEGEKEKLHLLMVDPHIPAGAKLY